MSRSSGAVSWRTPVNTTRERDREVDAVAQRCVRVGHALPAERGRDDVVEPEQHPHAEDRDREEHTAADADRTDRLRAEAADDDRVDEPHRHPAELGGDDGTRETEERYELAAESRARCRRRCAWRPT